MSNSGSKSIRMSRQRKMALVAIAFVVAVLMVILVSYVAAPPGVLKALFGFAAIP